MLLWYEIASCGLSVMGRVEEQIEHSFERVFERVAEGVVGRGYQGISGSKGVSSRIFFFYTLWLGLLFSNRFVLLSIRVLICCKNDCAYYTESSANLLLLPSQKDHIILLSVRRNLRLTARGRSTTLTIHTSLGNKRFQNRHWHWLWLWILL